jgi:trehalose 6-phosphate phosphatase
MKELFAGNNSSLLAGLAASRVLLAFDFDGTLAPIVDQPDDARMRRRTAELFGALCERYPCAVISGRAKADVLARLEGAPVKYVVGNHGLEPSPRLEEYAEEARAARRVLEAALRGERGLEIEDKKYSLAIHFRHAPRKPVARRQIARALDALPRSMRVVPGKLVFNVVPEDAPNKGDALMELRSLEGADTAIFVGDDVTDEDVFALDQPGSLFTIRIGRSSSSRAGYFLRDQRDIDRLLSRLVASRKASGNDAQIAFGGSQRNSDALDFLRRLWALNHSLETLSGNMTSRLGITAQQRLVIRLLGKYPGLPPGRLAAMLHLDPGTISAALRRLEAKELVLRRPDPKDRRRAALQLTAKGRRLDRAAPGTVENAVELLLGETPRKEIEVALRVLERLTDHLREEVVQEPPSNEQRERPRAGDAI